MTCHLGTESGMITPDGVAIGTTNRDMTVVPWVIPFARFLPTPVAGPDTVY